MLLCAMFKGPSNIVKTLAVCDVFKTITFVINNKIIAKGKRFAIGDVIMKEQRPLLPNIA
jgi:hypothetical protein